MSVNANLDSFLGNAFFGSENVIVPKWSEGRDHLVFLENHYELLAKEDSHYHIFFFENFMLNFHKQGGSVKLRKSDSTKKLSMVGVVPKQTYLPVSTSVKKLKIMLVGVFLPGCLLFD